MKNIDLLAESCKPVEPAAQPTPEQFKMSDDMIQRVAERVVKILSQPADQPDPDPDPEPEPEPEPEEIEGGDIE